MAPDMTKAKDSAASIFDILDSKPKIDSSLDEGTTLENVKGDIEFQHVSFRYPTRQGKHVIRKTEDFSVKLYQTVYEFDFVFFGV